MIYDVVIVGAGAAGLFASINLDKNLKKVILEKTAKPGMKVLLSGGERANVSNNDIEPQRDYFTQNKKFLLSVFSKYNQWDLMGFFAENGINIVEEDRSRLILESGDSKELLDCLLYNVKKNNCEIKLNSDVKDIKNIGQTQDLPLQDNCSSESSIHQNIYEVTTLDGKKYKSKNVIISSGGKSFAHIGTSGEGYNIAKKLGLEIVTPYRTLCGMSTKRDFSDISGVSTNLSMKLLDKNSKKVIYSENGPMLFTHFGISGPIVHNLSNAIGEYLNSLNLKEEDFEKYIIDNLSLDLEFEIENTPKRLLKFFNFLPFSKGVPEEGGGGIKKINNTVNIELQNWRSWKEAKATGGGISTNELDNYMQSKKYKGLYFIGEVVDVTGKTGGFNLQWAWSSGFVAAENINKNLQ